MNINNDKSTYKPPFSVVLVDAMDAYYYADIMGKMQQVALWRITESGGLANTLFVEKNYVWESLQAMNDVDGDMTRGFMTAGIRASTPPIRGARHSGSARTTANCHIPTFAKGSSLRDEDPRDERSALSYPMLRNHWGKTFLQATLLMNWIGRKIIEENVFGSACDRIQQGGGAA